MKTKQLFWGFLLLTIGLLFFADKYAIISVEWNFVWDLWPLVLVFWGISVLTKGTAFKPIVSALFGIFFGTMLYGSLFSVTNINYVDEGDYQTKTYSAQIDSSTKYAEFQLNAGAGKFIIKGNTDKLAEVYAKSGEDFLSFNTERTDSTQFVELTMNDKGIHILPNKVTSKLNIRLNSKPIWDFEFNTGACINYFDLSEYKVRNIKLQTGASKADIKIGDKFDKTKMKIEMGAASLKIRIPKLSGCELYGDMVLFSKHLKSFEKITSSHYKTPNFDQAENKILIKINGGVSKLSIRRY